MDQLVYYSRNVNALGHRKGKPGNLVVPSSELYTFVWMIELKNMDKKPYLLVLWTNIGIPVGYHGGT